MSDVKRPTSRGFKARASAKPKSKSMMANEPIPSYDVETEAKPEPNKFISGELRPSQLMFSYGPGAMVDLPNFSVMVMGVNEWPLRNRADLIITEDRLLAAVRKELGRPDIEALTLPPIKESDDQRGNHGTVGYIGVPVSPFPTWMVCPDCLTILNINSGAVEFHPHPKYPEQHLFRHEQCSRKRGSRKPALIPARFFVACPNGHVDEFPWSFFVHKGNTPCKGPLIMKGFTSDISRIFIECQGEDCDASRSLADAFGTQAKTAMPRCRAKFPHLRENDANGCEEQVKAMTLGSSNSWFPVTLSVLSIPQAPNQGQAALDEHLDRYWEKLKQLDNLAAVNANLFESMFAPPEFQAFTPEQVFEAILRRIKGLKTDLQEDLIMPEFRALSEPGSVRNSRDFQVQAAEVPEQYRQIIKKVVLVRRLREVRALIGFTRLDSPDHLDETLIEHRAPIAREKENMIPASEVRGEGLFLLFDLEAIQDWLSSNAIVRKHAQDFRKAHIAWRTARQYSNPEDHYPGLEYVFVHSLSHIFMRQLSLECGYTAASIREKIYRVPADFAEPVQGLGLLIYTAAPDSEGTLGGLVSLGETPERLGYLLDQALEAARFCSTDPLCAEHAISGRHHNALHGAACHACLFAPETSCERGNRYLDRAVLVPTEDQTQVAFFVPDEDESEL